MIIKSMKFRGYGPFTSQFAGFDEIRPINVIIGRNNSGKSHLLDLVGQMCGSAQPIQNMERQFVGTLSEPDLRQEFIESQAGTILYGGHWKHNGAYLVDKDVMWTIDALGNCALIEKPEVPNFIDRSYKQEEMLWKKVCQIVSPAKSQLFGFSFFRLQAERDVRREYSEGHFRLGQDGGGATNMLRRAFSSSYDLSLADLIRGEFLQSLQFVLGKDVLISGIEVREHDTDVAEKKYGQGCEIFLIENQKGRVPLSRSGSGLKTIILVLLNLLLRPKVEVPPIDLAKTVFAFEELENNLHPAVQRRLFRFIEQFAVKHKTTIFLTTHSGVALDHFGASKNAQIVQVLHHGDSATVERVTGYFQHQNVLHDLGARPSDMLQANGVIWVEGPSDRIYVNRWIDLVTGGEMREGRDYQCAFYGGSLLTQVEFDDPETTNSDLANLLTLNPNVAMLCDSDRVSKSGPLKLRVQRVVDQFSKIPRSFIWVTDCKEIENYLPAEALRESFSDASLVDPEQFESFYPRASKDGSSYLESRLRRRSYDKVDIAESIVPHMTVENMKPRFDWHERIQELVERIREWNK